ncbi:MAG: hypothetical protein Q4C42_00105 [Clostridia bacterium]|nr:hypothetical protein [Clostridia bacterium]
MKQILDRLLKNEGENHLLPFFWQHGEDETTLRKYVNIIHESGCGAFCVESRPHPDFCGEKWWHDMDAILDEAEKLNMKVWILDDSHFPTGYCNGAVENAPEELCRQGICCTHIELAGEKAEFNLKEVFPPEYEPVGFAKLVPMEKQGNDGRIFTDDKILSVVIKNTETGEVISVTDRIDGDKLCFEIPNGKWKMYIVGLTRNIGHNKNYMNMMSAPSCHKLIEAVYEPHFEHYGKMFGKTIAGFFSDEPELGNGQMYWFLTDMGTDCDLPYSSELDSELKSRLGENYADRLYLLWDNSGDYREVRFAFMDSMTKLIRENFSVQVGKWCEEHGVDYIGHLIEDGNVHTKTGSGLGHYFRGIHGQHYSGLDIIGGQLLPGDFSVTDDTFSGIHDLEMNHFMITEMAVSAAKIDPRKKGRTMCECFGASGWDMTMRLQKFIMDALLVRGVNYFTPHAFSPKAFPDPDCPPHFYAHGNNALYRAFGKLMNYTNRASELITGGIKTDEIAVLYPAESDWLGKSMKGQIVGRVLTENQIDFTFIPCDALTDKELYGTDFTDGLSINNHAYKAVIIPECDCLPDNVLRVLSELTIPVYFINRRPVGISGREYAGETIVLSELADRLSVYKTAKFIPECSWLRALRYKHPEGDVFMFVNENPDENAVWNGRIELPENKDFIRYDAYENKVFHFDSDNVEIRPLESLILVEGNCDEAAGLRLTAENSTVSEIINFKRSTCSGIDYPKFGDDENITLPEKLHELKPTFSGFVRYESDIEVNELPERAELFIEDAHEAVEVFVNGVSLGIRIVPEFRFDITENLSIGNNSLVIEVATTLEREVAEINKDLPPNPFMPQGEPHTQSGITGRVYLHTV